MPARVTSGPFTPAEAVHTSVRRSPDQAWGHVVVFSQWGRLAGWSELAIRSLPWLTGLLTLAWVYRIGRALFTARVALTAMLLLSTSVVFLTYMHKARSYGLAMLFAAIVLWAYWRVALHPLTPGLGARALLVLGATGLLYAHYFGALLLPALALFHLFFVRKERRWRQPVVLLGLAALLALPQVPDLLSGIAHNQEKDHLHAEALRYPEVIATFLRYLSNGLLEIRRPFSTLFTLALPLPLVLFGWRSRRNRQCPGAVWYLLLTGILLLLLLLGASEWLRVFEEKRVRYLVMLWLPSLLLFSQAFIQPSRVNLRRAAGLALVALVALAGASDFLLKGELVRFSRLRSETSISIAATRAIAAEGMDSGLLAVDRSGLFARFHRVYEFYTGSYGDRRVQLDQPAASNELLERAPGQDLVWLLASSSQEAALGVRAHLDHFRQEGWFHCRSSREAGVTLELLLPQFRRRCWIRRAFNSRMMSSCLRLLHRSCATVRCAFVPASAALMKFSSPVTHSPSTSWTCVPASALPRPTPALARAPTSRCAGKSTSLPCRLATTKCASRSTTGRPARASPPATSRLANTATSMCCTISASTETGC